MGKGNRGNKEVKKPKQVAPAQKSPDTGLVAPLPPIGHRPPAQKK